MCNIRKIKWAISKKNLLATNKQTKKSMKQPTELQTEGPEFKVTASNAGVYRVKFLIVWKLTKLFIGQNFEFSSDKVFSTSQFSDDFTITLLTFSKEYRANFRFNVFIANWPILHHKHTSDSSMRAA